MWTVVLFNDGEISVIYIGKSQRRAERLANLYDNPENCTYAHAEKYKGMSEETKEMLKYGKEEYMPPYQI